MESLNLNTLVNSLPAQQNAEKELLNDFKAAALSITTLYRSSRKNAKRAYNAGYATACQDLLNFIQHNVSVESSDGSNPSGMVSKVMDWTEARLDAIKATEEDEEEDEERENAKERGGRSAEASKASSGNAKKNNLNAVASTSRTSTSSLPTPHSPNPNSAASFPPQQPSSPSPPPSASLRPHYHPRPNKVRNMPSSKSVDPAVPFLSTQSSSIPSSIIPTGGVAPTATTATPTAAAFPDPTMPSSLDPVVIGAGVKRRHAMMMMMDPTSGAFGSPALPNPSMAEGAAARRRTRSARSLGLSTVHNQNGGSQQSDDMDVEEEGRERKRVARR